MKYIFLIAAIWNLLESLQEDFYFRVDNSVFIGPYLYGVSSQQTISYEFKGPSKGFDYYTKYFERLWNATELSCEHCGGL